MNLPKLFFSPIIPLWLLALFAILYVIFQLINFFNKQSVNFFHIAATSCLIILCASPQILKQKYSDAPLNIGIIRDYSPSIMVANRNIGIKNIEQNLSNKIKENANIKIIEETIASNNSETDYALAIERILQKAPANEIGAIFIISDGQTKITNNLKWPFPIHQILAGSPNEEDFFITLASQPIPVKIGEKAKIEFIIHNLSKKSEITKANLYINDVKSEISAKLNQKTIIEIPIKSRQTLKIAIEAIGSDKEISKANNAIITQVKPIEESLKVLLVTGEPYEGARAWRNLLKSDPAIDLVHFTILRSPQKLDNAHESELALIPFPTEELFLNKLDKFDLVIFDRFENLVGLRAEYLENITKYVQNGGAFLASLGPRDTIGQGIMGTSLKDILPIDGAPKQIDGEFIPSLSDFGKIHPITAPLNGIWGKWDRVFSTKAKGKVLMNAGVNPLIVIDNFGKGRVAVILSDKSWYWQRNYDGGGPFRELMGRIFYWLMNDEKLFESNLKLSHKDFSIILDYNFINPPNFVNIEGQNFAQNINIANGEKNQIKREFSGLPFGLYRAIADDKIAFAINGETTETIGRSLVANGNIFLNSLSEKNNSKIFYQGLKGDISLPKIVFIANSNIHIGEDIIIYNKKNKRIIETQPMPILDIRFMAIIILLFYFLAWGNVQKYFRKNN